MAKPESNTYVNIHGRRWGRGARPYLIMLKLLGVAAFVGGQILLLALVLLAPVPETPGAWQQQADTIHRAYLWVIVPGLWAAMLAGVILLLSIWRTLLRMRWFVVKMVLVAVCVPTLHLYMRDRSLTLQALVVRGEDAAARGARRELCWGMGASVAFGLAATWLGRVKPRLGQDFGRTFGERGSGVGGRG